ncbi:ABC transporter substrate-binding protein [Phytomonospora endophytica]|uniref:Lactose/L-arabinose transport system substrate-binding protein n=1 Tax=Phytomonospora endophytica TaxID=714109 RepID=A0A841FYR9_9ACTN|nr:sugar ABC transporter substrate-binding protein [Phytomonospora endophytica]MBB6038868.1 lactose/L-arabinose transport system substrate-binding protein [Phytomonospora endophytica]GIG68337.1 sugar ABC transporter substrate-binding protein [Phytomonospora endophytica]
MLFPARSAPRAAAALTATALAVASLTGCGGSGGDAGPAKDVDADKLTGTVTVWSWDVAATALTRLGQEFHAKYPNVTVDVVDVGYDNAEQKLSVGLKSGSGLPDLVTVESQQMQSYLGKFPKGFVDLTDVAGPYKADMDPSKWTAASDLDGRLAALPWDAGTAGLFYRTDYFEQAGVDPATISTWDDLITAGTKVKEATGAKLLVSDVSGSVGLVPLLMQQQGAGYFSPDGKITLDSPAAATSLDIVRRLNDAGLVHNEAGWDALVRANKDGKVATEPTGVWWSGTLTSEMPELSGKFGVMPLPAVTPGGARTASNGGSSLAIPAQAKNPDAAWAFAKFALADAANQTSMMKNEGLFPAYLPALKDPYFSQPQDYFGGQDIYTMFTEQTAKIPAITYTDDFAAAAELMKAVVSGVVLGGKDPTAELADAAEQLASTTGRERG